MKASLRPVLTMLIGCTAACGTLGAQTGQDKPAPDLRSSVLARAQVWRATNVAAKNLRLGPEGPDAFPPRATVYCEYRDKTLEGASPKFACRIGRDDEVKVKFGGTNAEVFGEVLATRVLWALGFGADRMYPVNVICRGCPEELGGIARPDREFRFDPAVIERKMSGAEWPDGTPGWSWEELDRVDTHVGGAPQAHRDALKLLAVFFQHTDTKPEQQRLVCLGQTVLRSPATCGRPFLMINDVGLTFGRASRSNEGDAGVNLERWRHTPVWKDDLSCTGNLPKSLTGTLDNPVISEQGRRFLAALLVQLSDRQLRDLFEVARVNLRLRDPGNVSAGYATVEEWVDAFKVKRQEIVKRRCA